MKITCSILIVLLCFGCNNKEISKTKNPKEAVQNQSINLEKSTCIFAHSEIDRYINFTKKKSEFNGSTYLQTIEKLNLELKKDCNFLKAKESILGYINSDAFQKESEKLKLSEDIKSEMRKSLLASSEKTAMIREVAKIIRAVSYHESNFRMNIQNNSAIERLSYVNGDTIELQKNTVYSFPTNYFLNEDLLYSDDVSYKNPTVNGGSTIGEIHVKNVEVNATLPLFQINSQFKLFIKTVE
ncbi:MAG: hypothetical protein P1U56_06455 [Saprospiraceae bacterium]|nr:hypothetical protein [Saprospiraceae bacterium]